MWRDRSSDIWAELGATQGESPCSSPWLREADRSLKHSPLLLSMLSQAQGFLAILLGEALICLFNGESKQQPEKSAPAFRTDCWGQRVWLEQHASKYQKHASTSAMGTEKGGLSTCYYSLGWTWTHTPSQKQQHKWQGKQSGFRSQNFCCSWGRETSTASGERRVETSSEGKTFAWWCPQTESL